jgi:hypothetical protein
MKPQEKSSWDKLLNIPTSVVAIATIILIIIPILYPLGLPIPIATPAKQYYNAVKVLPAGSHVIFWQDCSGSGWDEIKGGVVATLKMLFKQKVKVVMMSYIADGVPVTVDAFTTKLDPSKYGAVYGVDYVFLGYIPGEEAAVAAAAVNIQTLKTTDYKGTPVGQIPLMQEVKDQSSFDMLITYFGDGTAMEKYVRQWKIPFPRIIQVWGTPAGNEAQCVPYMASGAAAGYVSGPTGSAGLEILIGEPGMAAAITDVKNLASFPIIFLVALGNIAYFGKKYLGGKK